MNPNETADQALDALLRAPLEVSDDAFSDGVLRQIARHSASTTSVAADVIWPAWLVAMAGAVTVLPWDSPQPWLQGLSQHWQSLREMAEGLGAAAMPTQLLPSPEPALWLPVALALGLLLMLMPLTAD